MPSIDAITPDAIPSPGHPPGAFVVVTFNTGSGPELPHDRPPDDGYGSAEAELTDTWYGNGLAWLPLIVDVHAFFARTGPDLVAFQEIFHPGDCGEIPAEAHRGFICAEWQPGDPTVAQRVLGADWQVACHPGKPDKCLAVHARLGRFIGCDAALCLDGLAGAPVDGCGRGARVARAEVALSDAARDALGVDGSLNVVSFHGTSGFGAEEQACRLAQIEQVFVDLGDGQPGVGADGPALVLGDLNTDPGRAARIDPSAARWLDFVGPGLPFEFISAVGPDAPRTYADVFDIDHVIARGLTGRCEAPGVTIEPPVSEAVFFDHVPIVCGVGPTGSGSTD